jgi:hypothetical protein
MSYITTWFHQGRYLLQSQYLVIQQDNAALICFLRLQAGMASTANKYIAVCSDCVKVISGKNSGLIVKLKTHMLTSLCSRWEENAN